MKNFKIEIKWAVIFAIVLLLWMTMEKLMGFHDEKIAQHATVSMFFFIPATIVYVFALLDKRKNFYGGTMTYMQGLIAGLIISVVFMFLSPITQYITSTFITPDYFSNVIEYTVSTGELTQQEAEEYFNLKNYMWQGALSAPFFGLVTSAIIAIFVRKS